MEVRDSSEMRTKSLRIPSRPRSSTMRSPVRPPARPVATTGVSSRFSARATLIPLPPALVRLLLARCRWPNWKFGTVRVRSTAALRVTVTITATAPRRGGRLLDADLLADAKRGRVAAGVEVLEPRDRRPFLRRDRRERVAGLDRVRPELPSLVGMLPRRLRGHGRRVGVMLAVLEPGADDDCAD